MTLTPAERKVADLLREGRSNAEIAAALGVCLSTAKRHVSNMLRKAEVANRTTLALMLTSEPPQ